MLVSCQKWAPKLWIQWKKNASNNESCNLVRRAPGRWKVLYPTLSSTPFIPVCSCSSILFLLYNTQKLSLLLHRRLLLISRRRKAINISVRDTCYFASMEKRGWKKWCMPHRPRHSLLRSFQFSHTHAAFVAALHANAHFFTSPVNVVAFNISSHKREPFAFLTMFQWVN